MATLIDALVVSIGLDPKDFLKGQKQVEEGQKKLKDSSAKNSKEFDENSKKTSDAILKIRNQVVGLLAAFTAGKGMKDFLMSLTTSDSALGRVANNIGIAVDQLSAWQQVAEQSGGSANGITASMQNLTQQFQQLALTGQSSIVPFFRSIHVALADSSGKIRPMRDILFDLSDKFSKMDPAKAQALGRSMGLDEGTINVLMQGREALIKLLAEQEKLGHANEKDSKLAQARQKEFNQLKSAATNLGREVLTNLTPAIIALSESLKKFFEWAEKHPKLVTAAFAVLTTTVFGLSAALVGLNALKFVGLLGGIGSVGSALTGILGIVGAVGAAMSGWAIGDSIRDWVDSFITKMTGGSKRSLWDIFTGEDRSGLDSTGGFNQSEIDSVKDSGGAKLSNPSKSSIVPRGIRNNNPGNLNYAGQSGASLESGRGGRFAVFSSMEQGIQALASQLQKYASRGIDTIQGIISKYAPPGENDTGSYIRSIAKKLGISANQHLNLNDPKVLAALISGISTVENGSGRVSDAKIDSALRAGSASAVSRSSTNNSNSKNIDSQTTIGSIHINAPNATDSNAIAKSIGPAISQHSWAAQANYGLTT